MAGKKGRVTKNVKPDPGNAAPIGNFTDLPTNPTSTNYHDVDPDIKQIRMAITALRKSLFVGLGINASNYKHIIRIEPTGVGGKSASCGCGCS